MTPPLAQVRDLDKEVSRELALDPEAVAPIFGIDPIGDRDVPGRVTEVGRQARLDPTGVSSWPLGMGLVRFAWKVNPLSLLTGTGVLREYPI